MTTIELRSTHMYDREDLTQGCNAYLRTKLFMAKRISEQQIEIESLKNLLAIQTMKHAQLYENIKIINSQLESLKEDKNCRYEELSVDLANSLLIEEEKKKEGNKAYQNTDKEKLINALKNEILELKKENELTKFENIENKLFLNKVVNEKFLLFTELNELVSSLRRIDISLLNKFYLSNIRESYYHPKLKDNDFNSISHVTSSMGIKFNILSAQAQLSLLLSKQNIEYNIPTNEQLKEGQEEIIKSYFNDNEHIISIDKYSNLIKVYENELNNTINDKSNISKSLSNSKSFQKFTSFSTDYSI